ncbi:MAG TPA: TetR/AcrR family transcriptional regulator [Ilumatobacteraceae bacterium]|nr:TetR/AcrR family transcriptional regulator [Ilumatobacteraceae bacterium]
MAIADDMTTPLDTDHVDGRTLRRTRNRDAVIVALLAIIREGDLQPGAAEIADRAGVSHRSIFRYFDDLDDLVRTAIDHAFDEAGPMGGVPNIGVGSLDERITAFVDARVSLFEHVDGTMQLARMRAPKIPSINEGIAAIAEIFRVQIAEHFAPELDVVGEDERLLLVDGILTLTSYDSYSTHHRLLHSDVSRIRAAWVCALRSLLG